MGGIGEEWEEYDLTPDGRVEGEWYPGRSNRPPPAKRVLTYRLSETMPNLVVPRSTYVRFGDVKEPRTKALLEKFGPGPAGARPVSTELQEPENHHGAGDISDVRALSCAATNGPAMIRTAYTRPGTRCHPRDNSLQL